MTNLPGKPKLYLVIMILVSLLSVSCGKKYIGYGVLLWSPNEEILQTGATLPIISESKLNDTYTVQKSDSKEQIELPKWRLDVFETEEEAGKNGETVAQYKTIFAHNLKDGLLIRETPDVTSNRVYKMKRGQIIKIIGRTDKMAEVGQYTGFWYKVLTEDGIKGYCFDHYLDIFDSSIPPEKQVNPAEVLMRKAFSQNYHPASFTTMLKHSSIILSYFKPEIGIFPDIENKSIKVTTNSFTKTFSWDELVLIDKRTFELGDSGFEISVISDNHIRVVYPYEGTKMRGDYYVIDNMDEIIAAEMDRREELYQQLMNETKPYESSAYGSITFFGGRDFRWQNYERLVPQIIPQDAGETGKISFDTFISPDIETDSDGVLTFIFNSGTGKEYIYFLYTLSEGKLKLTYIPSTYISEHLVKRVTSSPLILAFNAQ